MKSEISSPEVHIMVKELCMLKGARVDKIYQLDSKDIIVQLHKTSFGRLKVRLWAPRAFFMTVRNYEYPPNPLSFCIQLRKHLESTSLSEITQHDSERVVQLKFESKSNSFYLIVELFSKGNIVLCDKEHNIMALAERQQWSTREVKPKSKYLFPKSKANFLEASEIELSTILSSSDRDSVVKSLAMDLGLGGIYAEEICLLSSTEKKLKPSDVSRDQSVKILRSLHKFLSSQVKPAIIYDNGKPINVVPIELKAYSGMDRKEFDTFSAALDYHYEHEFKELSLHEKKLITINRIISEQEDALIQMDKDIEENTKKGDAIYSSYGVVDDVLTELTKARKKFSWKEIKEKLKGHKVVKEINEKDGKVIVEVQ